MNELDNDKYNNVIPIDITRIRTDLSECIHRIYLRYVMNEISKFLACCDMLRL